MKEPIILNLDLLQFQKKINVKRENGVRYIFGHIRKKYFVFTPEELVRQLLIHYLIVEKKYRKNHIAVEKSILVNGQKRRYDIMIFAPDMSPKLLVECKAPQVTLNQDALDQIARYNIALKVPYLLVTNGLTAYCCKINFKESAYEFLSEVPGW